MQKIKAVYAEFPRNFWLLMGVSFIDRLGGALLFPFFALYVTDHFDVGLTEVGYLFAIFAGSSLVGGLIGGGLTDRFGRRGMIIFGLIASASSSVVMAFVNDLFIFYGVALFAGLVANAGGPAQQAMVADLLPEEKRAEGFGIWRVVANLAVTIGPAIGGFVAARSYFGLFMIDAVTSVITAVLVRALLPETKPELAEHETQESLSQTFGGYGRVLRDGLYLLFLAAGMLTALVYVQMNSTLPVYLRDVHDVPAQGYGFLLSLNAAMVVLMQFWVTRRVSGQRPLLIMACGAMLYAIGFTLYGFTAHFGWFIVAMIIITMGEMLISPVSQAVTAKFAPEAMRGRYMALAGLSWTIPFAIGPLLAGLLVDNYNPNWVWYLCGIVGTIAAGCYLLLINMAHARLESQKI